MDKEIEQQLLKLRQDASELLKTADRIEAMVKDYPDLNRHVGRWNKEVYCSPSVNESCTDFETRFNCGCCGDSPLEFWAFFGNEKVGKVYAYPPKIVIGQKNYFGFMSPDVGWKEKLRAEKIPEALIEKMAAKFEDEKEKAKRELSESFEEQINSIEPDPFI